VETFSAGSHLTVDESMSMWLGADGKYKTSGMHHVTKMKSKPRGIGLMFKTMCCGISGVMLKLDMCEAKEFQDLKDFVVRGRNLPRDDNYNRQEAQGNVYKQHTATTLRLAKSYFGTYRTVIGDSWFGSMSTLKALREHGLYFMGNVKTAHTDFPKDCLSKWQNDGEKANPRLPRGSHVAYTTTYQLNKTGDQIHQVMAVGWSDSKLISLVSNRSTTLDGIPVERVWDKIIQDPGTENEEDHQMSLLVPRPKVIEDYFQYFSAVDVHDRYRQGTLAIEEHWPTKRWWTRVFSTIIGMIVTDAFLAYRYEKKLYDDSHDYFDAFFEDLIYALVKENSFENPMELRNRYSEVNSVNFYLN
jgi:hypothetical protein